MASIADAQRGQFQTSELQHPSRRKNQSRDDPFLQLPITPSPRISPPHTPGESSEDQPGNDTEIAQHESIFLKIILTPILVTSFVLSLFLVNTRDRSARAGASTSLLSYLSPFAWLSAEPYQDPKETTWGLSPTSDTHQPHMQGGDTNSKGGKWFIRKKHRKMAKLQISDALDMDSTVMLSMCVVLVVGMGLSDWGARWLYGLYAR